MNALEVAGHGRGSKPLVMQSGNAAIDYSYVKELAKRFASQVILYCTIISACQTAREEASRSDNRNGNQKRKKSGSGKQEAKGKRQGLASYGLRVGG